MIKVVNKLNPGAWNRIKVRVNSGQDPVIDTMLKQWAKRYEAFTRRRFNQYARGGGNWKPLALSTVKARRKGSGSNRAVRSSLARDTQRGGRLVQAGGTVSILIDTGKMQTALSIGATGNLTQLRGRNTIRYGFSNTKVPGSELTMQQLAGYHNQGGSSGNNPPKRVILAQPDNPTQDGMRRDLNRALNTIMKQEAAK